MSEPATIHPVVKPKRSRLQFGLGGMVLFVMFSGSVGFVVVRWEPWTIERIQSLMNENQEYLIPPGLKYKQSSGRKIINVETGAILGDGFEYTYDYYDEGKKVLLVDALGKAVVVNWITGQKCCVLATEIQLRSDSAIVFSNNDSLLFCYDKEGHLNVFDTSTGQILCAHKLDANSVHGCISSDGSRCVIQNRKDDKHFIWNTRTNAFIPLEGITRGDRLDFFPDNESLLIGDGSGLAVRDADTGKVKRKFTFADKVWGTTLSPDGKTIAVSFSTNGDTEDFTSLVDSVSGTTRFHFRGDPMYFFPDNSRLITYGDTSFFIYNCATGQQCAELPGELDDVWFSTNENSFKARRRHLQLLKCVKRFPDNPTGHLHCPEVWLAIIFGSLWLWRASVWWRRRRTA